MELNRQKKQQAENKRCLKCTASLVVREMLDESSLGFHLTLVRVAIAKKMSDKCWGGAVCRRKVHCTLWWEWKTSEATMETSVEISQEAEDRTLRRPVCAALNTHSDNSVCCCRDPCVSIACSCLWTSTFIAAVLTITSKWNRCTYPPTDTWIMKLWCILHNGILFSPKKWNYEICS